MDKYTIRACSHEMSQLSNMENSAMRACARCQKKPIRRVKFQPVGRPSKTSADGEESRHRWCIRIDRATRVKGPVQMIETLSSEKTNRHDEHHEECHGAVYCESVQGVDRHATSRWESIWTAKSCEREERQLELQGVHIGVHDGTTVALRPLPSGYSLCTGLS